MSVDSLLTGLSNWGLAFVFNKALWGVGVVAEGCRQRAVESPGSPSSRDIAEIGRAKPTTETRRTAKVGKALKRAYRRNPTPAEQTQPGLGTPESPTSRVIGKDKTYLG